MCSDSVPSSAGLSTHSLDRDCSSLSITHQNAALKGSHTLRTQGPEKNQQQVPCCCQPASQPALEKLILKKWLSRSLVFFYLAVDVVLVSKKMHKKSWSQHIEDVDPCSRRKNRKWEGFALQQRGSLASKIKISSAPQKMNWKSFHSAAKLCRRIEKLTG